MAGVRQHGWRAIPAVCSEYGADTLPDRYRSDGRCLLFRQQAGISALKQELEVKTPYRAMNHPVIGVVTKADLASMEQISLVTSWLREAGARNTMEVGWEPWIPNTAQVYPKCLDQKIRNKLVYRNTN